MTEKPSDRLRLARIFSFDIVPQYLLEQVKGRSWTVDTLYEWGSFIGGQPDQIIFAMLTPEDEVKGIVWATANPIMDGIYISIISVDREYQDRIIGEKVTDTMKDLAQKLGLSKILGITTRPRGAERHGWTRTKKELVEV